MTAAGGNLLYHHMLTKKPSINSAISDNSLLSANSYVEETDSRKMSRVSLVSEKILESTTALKRLSQRISTVFNNTFFNKQVVGLVHLKVESNTNSVPSVLCILRR